MNAEARKSKRERLKREKNRDKDEKTFRIEAERKNQTTEK